jgi:DNA-binding CsgD family transcriptional regulator
MPDIVLSEEQQRALRSLIAAEAVPGSPIPHQRILEKIAVLVPCDGLAVVVADMSGGLLDMVDLPRPREDHELVDAVVLRFRNGADLVVELELARRARPFNDRDLALVRMLEPVCARLFRERPTPHLPADLTVQERRVLRLVAAGLSNAQVAERLGIAPSTVRKHLEHAYPKLGVTNRHAAAVTFEGRARPDAEGAIPVQRYA